ncbi:MAG: hypothetical protein GY934_09480 [Gammaproteobacteria bacterium]|nr:hypothetical protein [Gammaproteobacteria bacterium]
MKPLIIPDYWTAEEALAVYDFIDAIRDEIWSRYEMQLIDIIQKENSTNPADWASYENEAGTDEDVSF